MRKRRLKGPLLKDVKFNLYSACLKLNYFSNLETGKHSGAVDMKIISSNCYTSYTKGAQIYSKKGWILATLKVQNSSSHLNMDGTFAYVHGGLASAWRAALFQSSWHLQLQLGGIYFISLMSFLTDSFNAFVTKTEECHINLLFHYDNCVFFFFFFFFQNSVSLHKTSSPSTGLLGEWVTSSFGCHNYWMIYHLEMLILMVLL